MPRTSPTTDELRSHLQRLLPSLREQFGVATVRVFGSVARGEARQDSDVDLLVSFERPIGLIGMARLQRLLSDHLGREVDLTTEGALHPLLRESILAEAVDAA